MKITINGITKEEALAKFLECEVDDLESTYDHYGMDQFTYGGNDYAVATDEEADKAVAENIEQSAWAFNASFLAEQTELPIECFEAMQDKCEDSNDAVIKLINKTCGLDEFVEEAVRYDGRGHFLSGYDGHEQEESGFYIYKN